MPRALLQLGETRIISSDGAVTDHLRHAYNTTDSRSIAPAILQQKGLSSGNET